MTLGELVSRFVKFNPRLIETTTVDPGTPEEILRYVSERFSTSESLIVSLVEDFISKDNLDVDELAWDWFESTTGYLDTLRDRDALYVYRLRNERLIKDTLVNAYRTAQRVWVDKLKGCNDPNLVAFGQERLRLLSYETCRLA